MKGHTLGCATTRQYRLHVDIVLILMEEVLCKRNDGRLHLKSPRQHDVKSQTPRHPRHYLLYVPRRLMQDVRCVVLWYCVHVFPWIIEPHLFACNCICNQYLPIWRQAVHTFWFPCRIRVVYQLSRFFHVSEC